MRVCWNWQTGTFEVRVLYDIRVQVPSPAPVKIVLLDGLYFFTCDSSLSVLDFFHFRGQKY